MSERAPRLNMYGEPVVPVVDARQESLAQRPTNQQALVALDALLRAWWPTVLCRGWYGTLSIDISVRDGMIEQDIAITERRKRRLRD